MTGAELTRDASEHAEEQLAVLAQSIVEISKQPFFSFMDIRNATILSVICMEGMPISKPRLHGILLAKWKFEISRTEIFERAGDLCNLGLLYECEQLDRALNQGRPAKYYYITPIGRKLLKNLFDQITLVHSKAITKAGGHLVDQSCVISESSFQTSPPENGRSLQ